MSIEERARKLAERNAYKVTELVRQSQCGFDWEGDKYHENLVNALAKLFLDVHTELAKG